MNKTLSIVEPEFWRPEEVERFTSLKKRTLVKMMQRGVFPVCLQLTTRRIAWRVSDVRAWADERSSGVLPAQPSMQTARAKRQPSRHSRARRKP